MLNFMFFRYKKINDISTHYGFRVNSFFFSFLMTHLDSYDESGCNPPKCDGSWYNNQTFTYFVLTSKAKGGPSVASVDDVLSSWLRRRRTSLAAVRLSDRQMDRRVELCPFYSLASTEWFSRSVLGSQCTDVKIQLYALWHWILCECLHGQTPTSPAVNVTHVLME